MPKDQEFDTGLAGAELLYAATGCNINDEVWCVVSQGKGYDALPGTLLAAHMELFMENGNPAMVISLHVEPIAMHVDPSDVFRARHQALRAITERKED